MDVQSDTHLVAVRVDQGYNQNHYFCPMNATIKTILLTLLTLSVLTIAMIEVSGISENKLADLFKSAKTSETNEPNSTAPPVAEPNAEKKEREEKMRTMDKTMILVRDSIFDFGQIKEGDVVSHTYVVQNVGDKPLFIANVATSCGCTAPKYPKESIMPGAKSEITLEFNSAGKGGAQAKNALIICNATNAPYSIGFTANVQ